MFGRQRVVWSLVALFVGTNAIGLMLSQSRQQAEAATNKELLRIKGLQGDALSKWHNARVTPVDSPDCRRALSELGPASVLALPLGARQLDKESLADETLADLEDTLAELLSAFRRGKPSDVISYMRSRGESLAEPSIDRIRDYLTSRFGFTEAELSAKTSEEIFKLCWEVDNVEPAFESLLPDQSGINFFEVSQNASELLSDTSKFSNADFEVWRWRSVSHHNFANPTDSLDSQLASHGSVQVADARLIVKHRGGGVHSTCPYLIRFWYSNSRQKWIPHSFVQIRTSRDVPRGLFF